MAEQTTKTINLDVGFTDKKKVEHTRVTFGKRLKGSDLINIDSDPQSNIATQHQLLILRAAITEFGSLPMPVTLQQLLSLDAIDIADLIAAYGDFLRATAGERKAEVISPSEVHLAIGYEANGLTYTHATFGNRLTGMDMVEADKANLEGLKRECFFIGCQIAKLSTEDGAYYLDGPIAIEVFEKLDGNDISALRMGALAWQQSFRARRQAVQAEAGKDSADDGVSHKLERREDTVAATGTAQ